MDPSNELETLRNEIIADPYSPFSHIKLLNKLHELSASEEDIERARSEMKLSVAPSEQIWLQQIQDYYDWNKTRQELNTLFLEAIQASPTIDIMEKYGQFLLEEEQVENDSESVSSEHSYISSFANRLEYTQYDIPNSHKVWNLYIDFYLKMLEIEQTNKPSSTPTPLMHRVKQNYTARLRVPHADISSTFSSFSSFITSYFNANYESEMIAANKVYSETLKSLNYRDSWEATLAADPSLQTFADYIQWELERPKRYFRAELISGLYERALQLYQYVPEVWDDYVIFMCEQKVFSRERIESIAERATKACPTSGSLWAHRIRISEIHESDAELVIEFKLKLDEMPAFSSDVNNNYNSWKSLTLAWIPYLYRVNEQSGDQFIDQVINECDLSFELANSYAKDEYFEVESLVISIFTKLARIDEARECWKKVSKYQGTKSIFWLKWFEWEKSLADNYAGASNVLKVAISRNNIDWPEMITQAHLEFQRSDGSAYSTQQAVIAVRRKAYAIAKKRHDILQQEKKEKKDGKDEQAQTETPLESKKRTRSIDTDAPSKQQKVDRNRELNTIIVSNLPSDTSETDLNSLFNDCGEILSITQQTDNSSAIVEFSNQDGCKAALTKDLGTLEVSSGYQTTLFVTNFPSSTSKESLTELFKPYGNIISIRFPSLELKSKRRFCYIQFSQSESANKALQLDGSPHFNAKETLVVKISDPANKQNRSGGFVEGREVFVKGVDFSIGEDIIRTRFQPYGNIEKFRLPSSKRPGRVHDGYGFVTFSTVEEANAAVNGLNGVVLGDNSRSIIVSIAGKNKPVDEKKTSKGGNSKVYISNLSKNVTESQLRTIGEEHGEVQSVTIRKDLEGAIIEYKSVSNAGRAALALQGRVIDETPIQVGTSIVPPTKKSTMFVPVKARKRK